MDSLPFWTPPFRAAKRGRCLYRIGDIPVWPVPWRIYAVQGIGAGLVFTLAVGWLLDIGAEGLIMWYLLIPACCGVIAGQEVRDGKRPHQWLASMLAGQAHRVGLLPSGMVRVRRPSWHRVEARLWRG